MIVPLCLAVWIVLAITGCAHLDPGANANDQTQIHGYIESSWTKRF